MQRKHRARLTFTPPLLLFCSTQAAFKKLEVLILERNRLEGDADLTSLSKAPRLRELNLSFNYFKRIPEAAAMGTGFRMLEWLSLANNYIASERDILPLVRFPRLLQVILYVSASLPNTRASPTLPTYPPPTPVRYCSYGNPITESQQGRAATAEAEPTVGRNAALNAEETDGKIVNLVTDTPAIRKKLLASLWHGHWVTDTCVCDAVRRYWAQGGVQQLSHHQGH